jgi:Arc/MetJ-type ribon-helix-helix transcriptional regulator
MGRKKAVVSADAGPMAEVERLVAEGQYASVSEFVRQAVAEKLARHRRTRLEEQVARYCAGSEADAEDDLVSGQAFPRDDDT